MFYAILDENNVCIGHNSMEPDEDTAIALGHKIIEVDGAWDDSLHFKIYDADTKTWLDPPAPEPVPEVPRVTNEEIKENQLITMDAIATIFELLIGGV